MTLQTRTLLMVTILLFAAVLATSAAITWTSRQAIIEQTEADGILIARLLARSAGFAEQVPRDVEAALGEQMIVEATIAAHLVSIAEEAGLDPQEINAHLQAITDQTALDEFWITDESGHAYLTNMTSVDFTFDPDPERQPQAHVFWPLLTGEQDQVVQEAHQREIDTEVFKYAGVSGIDHPRIVQVGYHATFLARLTETVGITRLVQELLADHNVDAIGIVDSDLVVLAYSSVPGLDISLSQNIGDKDKAYLQRVVREARTLSYQDGSILKVMVPITNAQGDITGATLVHLSMDRAQAALRHELLLATIVAAVVLVVGLLASMVLARRVTEPVARLTAAAAAIEAEAFDPDCLSDVAQRQDEIGRLAHVFQHMAREVYKREQYLKQQVKELRVEIDQTKRAHQVAEITETEYFQELQKKVKDLRSRVETGEK